MSKNGRLLSGSVIYGLSFFIAGRGLARSYILQRTSDYETEVDFGWSPSTIVAMSGADLSDDEGAQPHGSESPCLCAR